jgi:alginate O-acetyltransferase complex protein AlgI
VAWIGAICFPLQLYFDFSGYSDMAVGMGRMLDSASPAISITLSDALRAGSGPLAHHALVLAGGLHFHPVGRLPLRPRPGHVQHPGDVFPLRALAWRQLEFRAVRSHPGIWIIAERLFSVNAWFYKTPLMHLYTKSMILVCMILFRTETLPMPALPAGDAGPGRGASAAIKAGFYLNPEVLTALAAGLIGSVPFAPWLKSCFAAWGDRQRAAGGYAWAEPGPAGWAVGISRGGADGVRDENWPRGRIPVYLFQVLIHAR